MKKLFIILLTATFCSCSSKQIRYEDLPEDKQEETIVTDDGIYRKIAVAVKD